MIILDRNVVKLSPKTIFLGLSLMNILIKKEFVTIIHRHTPRYI